MVSISTLILSLLFQIASTATVIRSSSGNFQSARCFVMQQNGNIFLLDEKMNLIQQYTANGTIIRSTGGHGVGNYEFDNPTDVSSSFLLDIYVADFNNRRIQRFDKNLNYIQTYDQATLSGEVGGFQPRACALSTQGEMFVIDTDGNRILKIDARGRYEKEFGTFKDGAGTVAEPKDIAVSAANDVYLLDKSRIIAYDHFGNYLKTITLPAADWKSIQISSTALTATAHDRIFIRYLDSDAQTTITRLSIVGVSSGESFVDAVLQGNHLTLLTSISLYYCTITR